MRPEDKEILDQFAGGLLSELKAVSGSFGDSIEYRYDGDALIIEASPFIRVLIDGRAPTKPGAKKGSPTLQEALLGWINRHSITPRPNKDGKSTPTREQLSYIIANSIHRKGTLLYQRGGGNKIFDNILTPQRFESLFSVLGNSYLNYVSSQVTDQFSKL